jgi:phage-related protein
MSTKTKKPAALTLKDAFETEFARREMERRAREEAERKQQEGDLASAVALHAALTADGAFLAKRGLSADIRRYTVTLDHADYRIAAYFEAGKANVTTADKRTANPGSTALRKRETAETVEDALKVMAQFLADETR